MIRVPPPNEKLTEIIRKIGVKKLISIEINPYLPVDYQLIAKIAPNFCSVIWIARPNDSKNPRMLNPLIVSKELIRRGYTVLVHIPGIFYSRHEMKNILTILKEYGIRNIFAMRGGGPWLKIKNADFSLAQIFIEFIRDEFRGYFDIIIAGFPNVHPASNSMEQEMFFLRNKIVSGANIILTQACMTPERYLNYKKYALCMLLIFR
ncbi:hypothetical protein HHI36_004040 [Cryptolaemus montrouzieri]|uniref:Methylenetetrahydrofolate reductase (NAD(P)H) n=1 Tax=Cryptolaemus montrouzieri TaxID=559131 RepID=A0ABD2NQN7_9CUCU